MRGAARAVGRLRPPGHAAAAGSAAGHGTPRGGAAGRGDRRLARGGAGGRAGRARLLRAGGRGPALGRRVAPRVPRGARGLDRGRSPARRVRRPTRDVRSPSGVGRGEAQLPHAVPGSAVELGDGAAAVGAAGRSGARCAHPSGDPPAVRWEPAVRGGVRADALRPRSARPRRPGGRGPRGGHRGAAHDPGPDRRAVGRAPARSQAAAARRRRPRQGVLA